MSLDLPIMQCDPGCGECCGPVICTRQEYQQVAAAAKRKGVEPLRQFPTCPWYQNGQCQVYDFRPFLCRLFGHCEGLVCCKGYNVNAPAVKVERAMREYRKRTQDDLSFLHEACYSLDEIKELMATELQPRT